MHAGNNIALLGSDGFNVIVQVSDSPSDGSHIIGTYPSKVETCDLFCAMRAVGGTSCKFPHITPHNKNKNPCLLCPHSPIKSVIICHIKELLCVLSFYLASDETDTSLTLT